MRKMMYAAIAAIPAAALAYLAFHLAKTHYGFLWLAPAAVAAVLCVIAVLILLSKSTPTLPHVDRALTASLKRWLKVQNDEKRDADKSTRAAHTSSRL
jgi:hypothetical protein